MENDDRTVFYFHLFVCLHFFLLMIILAFVLVLLCIQMTERKNDDYDEASVNSRDRSMESKKK